MSSRAFIDHNFSNGREFLIRFLDSYEFTLDTLRSIIGKGSSNKRKFELVQNIATAYEDGQLSSDKILLPYVQRSRQWLSFKLGQAKLQPEKRKAELLLYEFGEEGWYGPIKDNQNNSYFYVNVSKISDYQGRKIRWTVIAELTSNYIALSWNGFTLIPPTDSNVERQVQFAFWKHIPQYFKEVIEFCHAGCDTPDLHKLILHHMWDSYIRSEEYQWQHIRIRAESAGVALNAHSSGIKEINVKGLEALSSKLATSALIALRIVDNPEKQILAESAILRALLKEWGTKSYEFSLDKKDLKKKSRYNRLIKAHCYFGLRPNSSTQDSLQHLKCDCGGSTAVLKFLLEELEFYGNENM